MARTKECCDKCKRTNEVVRRTAVYGALAAFISWMLATVTIMVYIGNILGNNNAALAFVGGMFLSAIIVLFGVKCAKVSEELCG